MWARCSAYSVASTRTRTCPTVSKWPRAASGGPPPGSWLRSPPWPWRSPFCSARLSPWPLPDAAPAPKHRRPSANVPGPGPTGRPEVILQDAFTVEPWNLRETHLDLDLLAQSESVFALANGHVGWRANLDEGEPHALPGSYLTASTSRGRCPTPSRPTAS